MGGRTVKIYLVDGFPTGLITAEIINWTGKFTVVPRSQLADLARREEARRPGVYFLIGTNPDDPSQESVYIGESDNIWNRLAQHNKDADKDFWEKTVIVTSKDENLTKAHVRYLECRLIQITKQAKRVQIFNGTNPDPTCLPEPDIADMEYFVEQIQMILPVLGFSFAIPLPSIAIPSTLITAQELSPVFCMSYSGVSAQAQLINGEFVVLEGSYARKENTPGLLEGYIRKRQNLISNGSLIESPDLNQLKFVENVPFPSPSQAAIVVGGASLNGRKQWKVQGTQQSYSEWQEQMMEIAGKKENINL